MEATQHSPPSINPNLAEILVRIARTARHTPMSDRLELLAKAREARG